MTGALGDELIPEERRTKRGYSKTDRAHQNALVLLIESPHLRWEYPDNGVTVSTGLVDATMAEGADHG
jgi:hypothetical protein